MDSSNGIGQEKESETMNHASALSTKCLPTVLLETQASPAIVLPCAQQHRDQCRIN
eukprot:SAG31_NODE_36146_length_316_cov_0.709677_1_plen_55_part_01